MRSPRAGAGNRSSIRMAAAQLAVATEVRAAERGGLPAAPCFFSRSLFAYPDRQAASPTAVLGTGALEGGIRLPSGWLLRPAMGTGQTGVIRQRWRPPRPAAAAAPGMTAPLPGRRRS